MSMIDFELYVKTIRSLYIYGKTKSGKTTAALEFVKNHQYDYNYVTIQQIKNENDFTKLMESQNVYNMFFQKPSQQNKRIKKVIIVDNIDYLQNGDKKILNMLVKSFSNYFNTYKHIFFIFIGTNESDKKVLELMGQMEEKVRCVPLVEVDYDKAMKKVVKEYLCRDSSVSVRGLCDKNIISLCYHENIINHIQQNTHYYEEFLNQFCHGDYYDRLSFQKQLWQFNEMTFHLKVVNNHHLLKSYAFPETIQDEQEVLFTKILTKFSNEYSNLNFLIGLCRKLNCQKEELFEIVQKGEKHPGINTQEKKRLGKLMG